jgi:hypothetical protein
MPGALMTGYIPVAKVGSVKWDFNDSQALLLLIRGCRCINPATPLDKMMPELTESSTAWHFFILIHYLYYSDEAVAAYGETYG